jgi:hypothetical protein
MGWIRFALSAPFYGLAFVCHLLATLFTFIAESLYEGPENVSGNGSTRNSLRDR